MQPQSWWKKYGAYFLTALFIIFIRSAPEKWIGPTPLGSDSSTSYLNAFYTYNNNLFYSTTHFNLFYFILKLERLTGLNAFLAIKIDGILLYFLMVLSFGYLVKNIFGLKRKTLLFSIIFFATQLSTLRFSWDLFRNELGLIGLFLFLGFLVQAKKNLFSALGAILSALVVLCSHQLVTLVLIQLIIGISLIVLAYRKNGTTRGYWWVLVVGWMLIWPFVAGIIQFQGLSLRETAAILATYKYHIEGKLFLLQYIPLLPLVFLGFQKYKPKDKLQPIILGFIITILSEQSLIGLFFPSLTFANADRWIYLMGPFLILGALAGLLAGRTSKSTRIIASICLALQLIVGFYFWWPRFTLYEFTFLDKSLFSFFPARMVSNSLIANYYERALADTLPDCFSQVATQQDKYTNLFVESRYSGTSLYYLSSAIWPKLVFLSSPPTVSLPNTWLLGYDFKPSGNWQKAVENNCPIYQPSL